jgi:hypothetical protein
MSTIEIADLAWRAACHLQPVQDGAHPCFDRAGPGVRMRPQDRSDALLEFGTFPRRQLIGGLGRRNVVVGQPHAHHDAASTSLSGSVTRWEPPSSDNSTSMRSCGLTRYDGRTDPSGCAPHRRAGAVAVSTIDKSIALAAADRRDHPVGHAFFNAALRRANNLKDAFLMARSLIVRCLPEADRTVG